ncbi:hypothetical protein BDAP_000683 [Binucleata daphniae]
MKNDKINCFKQAIINNDILYLQSHITSENKIDFIELTQEDKINFFILLKKNIKKFGLVKEILNVAKDLIYTIDYKDAKMCKVIDDFCHGLGKQCSEFSRIVYLKGKIEYLKNKKMEMQSKKPQCEINDK